MSKSHTDTSKPDIDMSKPHTDTSKPDIDMTDIQT